MSVNLEKVGGMGEADDWLECPDCGSSDCRVQQDPDYIYFFCNDCDHYHDFEIATWT